ncbi:MAG: DUF1572 family protein [Vicinamibacteria bacterium]
MDFGAHFLKNCRFELGRLKELAEKAMAQVPAEMDLHRAFDAESNSIAVLVQHISGNLLSRWTDFLETDGEKPDRHRDREFETDPELTRAQLRELWERGWSRLFESLEALTPEDLSKTVRIRNEELTVPEAIQRSLVHTAYHVGQIVFLSKHLGSAKWSSLSIPSGRSESAPGGYKKA